MQADLHLHSTYSDGLYSPDEICKIARSRGLSLLSITDHDTLLGEADKRASAAKYDLAYLSGWEISAYEGRHKIHVLGYGCTMGKAYEDFTAERKAAAEARAKDSVQKFQAHGVPVTFDEVLSERLQADAPVHTMHVARAAAKHLHISEGETYLAWLSVGKPAHSDIGRPTPRQAIDCIHALGGIASVAHPGRIRMEETEREKLIRSLAEYGVDGIEVFYTTHTAKETAYFSALAEKLGLLKTGGSDTHIEDGIRAIGSPAFTPSSDFLSRLKINVTPHPCI